MERIQPRGHLICEIHASPLFATYEGSAADTLPVRLVQRVKGVRMGAFEMSHSVRVCFSSSSSSCPSRRSLQCPKKRLNDKTVAIFTTRALRHRQSNLNFLGTLRHQFSPRLSAEACIFLLLFGRASKGRARSDQRCFRLMSSDCLPIMKMTTIPFRRKRPLLLSRHMCYHRLAYPSIGDCFLADLHAGFLIFTSGDSRPSPLIFTFRHRLVLARHLYLVKIHLPTPNHLQLPDLLAACSTSR